MDEWLDLRILSLIIVLRLMEECKNMENQRLGMLTDYPDFRDYTFENRELLEKEEVYNLISPIGSEKIDLTTLPQCADPRLAALRLCTERGGSRFLVPTPAGGYGAFRIY